MADFFRNSEFTLGEKAVFESEHYRPYAFEDAYGSDGTARMRLDAEAVDDAKIDRWDLVVLILTKDLEDMLENGDKSKIDDPILKSIDGSKKRGKELVDVTLGNAVCYIEPKPKKQSEEITIFFQVYGVWQ